jgi:tRNA-dihydrouridine synthase B
MITSLKIGDVTLEDNLIMGPMAGYTDLPFRLVCEKYGKPSLVVTEMVSSKALFYGDEKTKQLLNTAGENSKVAVQIFGSDTESMGFSAKYLSENYHFDIIDINMGCPAPKVVKNGDGSRLMLDPSKVYDVTKSVVDNSKVPVTVKIRKGWDSEHINAVEVAKQIERAGAKMVTVHGRTRTEYYGGTADLDIIKQVKDNVSILVCGNGDVKSGEAAKNMFEYTNCDAIMISRGTLGNPWIFEQIRNYFKGEEQERILKEDLLEAMISHINLEVEDKGEDVGVREMRKHLCMYIHGLPNASELRNTINHIEKKDELISIINEFLK